MGPGWFTAQELADKRLPGMPATKRGVNLKAGSAGWNDAAFEGKRWRWRTRRGGGIEYCAAILPVAAQVRLAMEASAAAVDKNAAPVDAEVERRAAWAGWEKLTDKARQAAIRRAEALDALLALTASGVPRGEAMAAVKRQVRRAVSGLYAWEKLVEGRDRADWLPFLAPRHAGRPSPSEFDELAFDAFRALYMRKEKPTYESSYRHLKALAAAEGWQRVPSLRTLQRRIEAMGPQMITYEREGKAALDRLYPVQERRRDMMCALEAVNLDGHEWDVFVRWDDGTIGRPVMLAVQDLYSGMILAWRIDRTLHKGLVRLAFGDVVEQFGVPQHCFMDNGRENASKWITGGVPNRYRFKVRDDDPQGLLPQLGVGVHFTTPYSGQSKPIERAFRDFASDIAKHPAFAGAYVGNKPDAKPDNYGSTAVPIERFVAVLEGCIAEHNSRPGRESHVCRGLLSFQQVFKASYEFAPIRKATPEQRLLWLLPAEAVQVRKDGAIELSGNRYWSDRLLPFRGQKVTIRFDPDRLQQDLHVYRQDGGYVTAAPCIHAVGFMSMDAAREHNRNRRKVARAVADAAEAQRKMDVLEIAGRLPVFKPEAPPEAKVVRLVGNTVRVVETAVEADEDEAMHESDRLLIQSMQMRRGGVPLQLVEGGDD